MEFFKRKTHIPFMATRKWAYALAAACVLGSFALLAVRGLNLAVDFTGGITIEATFPRVADLDAVRRELVQAGYPDAQAQNFGSSREIVVRLPPVRGREASARIRAEIETVLQRADAGAEVVRLDVVGPQVGVELRESAYWSFAFAMLLIFAYVWLRFHTWKLSLAAIIATLFDPVIVLGFFALTQMSFDLSVVAAILAVVGYSLNDKVVIFDRIRERFHINRRMPPARVLDEAINETLSRTLMTAISTLIVLVSLYTLGGPTLQPFAAAMLVGVALGHFSSIYVA
ncbi:MAG TPA: protein translocase subunit SecF, partial [Steroidobacteraceae bacterium]|nr:protein translocase subunit SecF [Steroidobacteraceae bacterium]